HQGQQHKGCNQSPDVRVQSLPLNHQELKAWQTGGVHVGPPRFHLFSAIVYTSASVLFTFTASDLAGLRPRSLFVWFFYQGSFQGCIMSNWLLPESLADILPAEARRIEELRRDLLDLYRAYGFELVAPPLVEYLDSLLSGTGGDLNLRTCKL